MNYTYEELLREKAIRNAREDFWSYCLYMQYDYFTSRQTPLKELADALNEAWYSDKERYTLAISTPPRTGKSTILNHFCCWSLGKDMDRAIIRASYNQDLSDELSVNMKEILDSERHLEVFPTMPHRTVDSKSKIKFKGSHRTSYSATSVGGSATGYGCSMIITDDPYKDHNEALSPSINAKTISWYKSALQSRLDTKRQIEIVVCTRWTPFELIAKMEDSGYFDKVIKIKALVDGKSFNEDIISTEALTKLRDSDENGLFYAMYQQQPLETSNALITEDDLDYIGNREYRVHERIAVIDTKSTGKDYFVVVVGSVVTIGNRKHILVEDFICDDSTLADDRLENRIISFLNYYSPTYIFVETNHNYSFSTIIDRKVSMSKVVPFKSKMNKVQKILTYSKYLRKFIYQNQGEDLEYDAAIKQMCRYDLGKKTQFDDVIDTMSMLSSFVISYGHKIGFTEWLEDYKKVEDKNEFKRQL